MNSLTVNLYLMLATFYRPTKPRFKIVMEEPAFPSDSYAIKTQIVHHGFDPAEALVLVRPLEGELTVRAEQFEETFAKHRDSIAVAILGAVNFFTGQAFDIPRLAAAAHAQSITFGVDLAHAIGK